MSGNLRQELDLDQQHLSSPPGTTVQRVLDILALAAMALYGMECSVGSSGRWLQIGPISIRMILFCPGVCPLLAAAVADAPGGVSGQIFSALDRLRPVAGDLFLPGREGGATASPSRLPISPA